MDELPRHQCHIYDGSPARQLPVLVAVVRRKLKDNHRCLYLNSPPMVAGLRSYLAAAGVDVEKAIAQGSLVLSSSQQHLAEGRFDIDRMLSTLGGAASQALAAGYDGLCAIGDMSWEFGPEKDFEKLVDYELRLEEFFAAHPELCGVCQYHVETLPPEAVRRGLIMHPAIFVNETLSRLNPYHLPGVSATPDAMIRAELDETIEHLCHPAHRGKALPPKNRYN